MVTSSLVILEPSSYSKAFHSSSLAINLKPLVTSTFTIGVSCLDCSTSITFVDEVFVGSRPFDLDKGVILLDLLY